MSKLLRCFFAAALLLAPCWASFACCPAAPSENETSDDLDDGASSQDEALDDSHDDASSEDETLDGQDDAEQTLAGEWSGALRGGYTEWIDGEATTAERSMPFTITFDEDGDLTGLDFLPPSYSSWKYYWFAEPVELNGVGDSYAHDPGLFSGISQDASYAVVLEGLSYTPTSASLLCSCTYSARGGAGVCTRSRIRGGSIAAVDVRVDADQLFVTAQAHYESERWSSDTDATRQIVETWTATGILERAETSEDGVDDDSPGVSQAFAGEWSGELAGNSAASIDGGAETTTERSVSFTIAFDEDGYLARLSFPLPSRSYRGTAWYGYVAKLAEPGDSDYFLHYGHTSGEEGNGFLEELDYASETVSLRGLWNYCQWSAEWTEMIGGGAVADVEVCIDGDQLSASTEVVFRYEAYEWDAENREWVVWQVVETWTATGLLERAEISE